VYTPRPVCAQQCFLLASSWLLTLLRPEDGGSTLLRKFCQLLPNYIASSITRQYLRSVGLCGKLLPAFVNTVILGLGLRIPNRSGFTVCDVTGSSEARAYGK
jgi:hypothetical protein